MNIKGVYTRQWFECHLLLLEDIQKKPDEMEKTEETLQSILSSENVFFFYLKKIVCEECDQQFHRNSCTQKNTLHISHS